MRAALFIIALLLLPSALALGVSPASRTMAESGEFTFRAITDSPVTVRAEGDLAQHITFERTAIQPGDDIRGRIDLPQDIAPGNHQQYIVISAAGAAEDGFAGNAEVAASLLVQIPYPEEYLEASWDLTTDKGTGAALITVTFQNLGSREVAPLTRVLIGEQNIPVLTRQIAPGTLGKFTASALPEAPGVYEATLEARYADTLLTKTKGVRFGNPTLLLTGITYHDEAGAITPIDIAGAIQWNQDVNVSAAVYFDNDTAPVGSASFLAQGEFAQRIYITTERQPAAVRVVITADGASAEQAIEISAEEEPFPWLLLAVALIAALLLVFIWRKSFKGKGTGNEQGPL